MIILVEDNEELREALCECISQFGYKLKSFTTAEQALVAIQQEPEAPKVLITDVRLPGISGLSLIQKVRCNHPGIAVIVISSDVPAGCDELLSDRNLYTAVLKKPFPIKSLGTKLSEALGWDLTRTTCS